MRGPWFTIGHSTRTVEELVSLLREAGADTVVDVRTVPRSRTNPQFNADVLPDALATSGVGYRHISRLGGLRGHRKGAAPSPNGFWENASFRNYADYAMTAEFRAGLVELRSVADRHTCALTCAERPADPPAGALSAAVRPAAGVVADLSAGLPAPA